MSLVTPRNQILACRRQVSPRTRHNQTAVRSIAACAFRRLRGLAVRREIVIVFFGYGHRSAIRFTTECAQVRRERTRTTYRLCRTTLRPSEYSIPIVNVITRSNFG